MDSVAGSRAWAAYGRSRDAWMNVGGLVSTNSNVHVVRAICGWLPVRSTPNGSIFRPTHVGVWRIREHPVLSGARPYAFFTVVAVCAT